MHMTIRMKRTVNGGMSAKSERKQVSPVLLKDIKQHPPYRKHL